MESKLEKTILFLRNMEFTGRKIPWIDNRALLLVTLIFLITMLSIRPTNISMLLLFSIYPIVTAPICGESFSRIFIKSLWVLPFILFIGIFNPIYDQDTYLKIGEYTLSKGWITFISLTVRGLLGMQALLILIANDGFNGLCRSMTHLRVPGFLVTQMQFVFRYMLVLMEELLNMRRARDARSFGRKNYPIKFWGAMMGQLFIRTVDRSRRIHSAMMSRGFNGVLPFYSPQKICWKKRDSIFVIVWFMIFFILRLVNLSSYLSVLLPKF